MNLQEMINELKNTHDKKLFKKALNKLQILINQEIGESLNREPIYLLKDFDNKELEEFVKSEDGFRSLIEGNITDSESFSKIVDLIKELKELQFRRNKNDFFTSNIEKPFTEVTLESFGQKFKPDFLCYSKYAELSPYMILSPYIIMYDDYDGIDALSYYMDISGNSFHNNIEQYKNINININRKNLEKFIPIIFQNEQVFGMCTKFLQNTYSQDDLLLKNNGLLKHYIENNMIELFNNQDFIDTLHLIKDLDLYEDTKKEDARNFIIRQFKAAILEKLKYLNDEIDKNIDTDEVLKYVNVLCDEFLFIGLFDDDFLILELNDIFSKLKEKRGIY